LRRDFACRQKERAGKWRPGPSLFAGKCFQSTLAVSAASEATAVETTETATHMAETSDMCDTHAVRETATVEMSGTYTAAYAVVQVTHAMAEAATFEVGEP
jgi:hypothetical protein